MAVNVLTLAPYTHIHKHTHSNIPTLSLHAAAYNLFQLLQLLSASLCNTIAAELVRSVQLPAGGRGGVW